MTAESERGTTFTVVPVRHWGQWVLAVVVGLLVAWLAAAAASSHFLNPHVVDQYLFNSLILEGLLNTIFVSVAAQAIGVVLGVIFAVMRMSENLVLSAVSGVYVWFFRGTPVLVQLIFWFNGVPAVFHDLTIGIPFTHVTFFSMLKTSSLASVVTFGELLRRASDIYSSNLFVVELLVVASLWYLLLTTVASVGQYYVEKRFARGTARSQREGPWQRVLRNLRGTVRL